MGDISTGVGWKEADGWFEEAIHEYKEAEQIIGDNIKKSFELVGGKIIKNKEK